MLWYKHLASCGYDIYLCDQAGSGLSSRLQNPAEYTIDRHVADLELIRKIIGKSKLILIGGSIGINDFHIKDEYLSLLPYRGLMLSTRLSFEARLKSVKHEAEVYFNHGSPSPDNQAFDITQNIGLLAYSFMMKAGKANIADSPLTVYLGAGLSSFIMNSDLITNSKLGEGYYTDQNWYWFHSFNINAEGEYLISIDKTLIIKLQIPFFKIVTSPANGHWLGNQNKAVLNNFFNAAGGGKGEFFWKNSVPLSSMEYRQQLSSHFSFRGSYGFNYASSNTPFNMGMYMNNFSAGVDWIF